jgi:DNA-binding CsgD family transcriptional regulator
VEGIFGRDLELTAIEQFLNSTPSWPSAMVIEGEAGIGKTTLWLEGVRRAEERSIRALQARPAESEQKLSYIALADLVVGAFDEVGPTLPQVQQRALAGALVRGETVDGTSARTTATAFVGVLAACAERSAVLLAVDDVQWLDPASAESLAFALRRLPPKVGVLLAHRVELGQELPLGLTRALPEDRLLRIAPRPLSLAALHHLVKFRLGTSLPRPLLARLADASGGNPFYALEMARALAPEGDPKPTQPLPVPRNLEELVLSRVETLSASARQLALAAAATSQPTRSVLASALPADADFGAALLEAEEAGVLSSENERIRFEHPLLASVIYGSASAERRRQLHKRLALVVSDPEERARHLALCTTEPQEEIAAELEAAAGLAARRGAPEAAAELFSAAKRLTPPASKEKLTSRGLGEAKALLSAGDVGGARKIASEAAATSAASLRAEAELLLGDLDWIGGSWAHAIEHLENAIAAEPEDPALAARAYPKLVNYTVAHAPREGIERAERAFAALSSERVPAAVASVAFDSYWAGLLLGHGVRPGLLERWRELEDQAGPESSKSVIPLIYFHSVDDFDGARNRHAVEAEWYRVRGEEGWAAERLAHLGFVEFRAGRWDLAERLVEDSCTAIAQLERPGPWTMPFRLRSFVDAGRGRTERARTTLLRLIDQANRSGRTSWEALFLSTLAFVEFADDDHAAVDAALTRMYRCTEDAGIRDLIPDRSEPLHVESLVALGEIERARGALARLEERGQIFPRLWIDVTLPRARAIVLAGEGELEKAFAALDALDEAAAAKLPFDFAWTLLVRGRMHRRAKQRHAAAEVLRAALEQYEQLGAPSWIERTRAELDRVGLRRAPTELTATERRVAELAASGLTNREVASKAFMSPKTVQANLARVYRKLGISSRAELGARMSEERGGVRAQT